MKQYPKPWVVEETRWCAPRGVLDPRKCRDWCDRASPWGLHSYACAYFGQYNYSWRRYWLGSVAKHSGSDRCTNHQIGCHSWGIAGSTTQTFVAGAAVVQDSSGVRYSSTEKLCLDLMLGPPEMPCVSCGCSKVIHMNFCSLRVHLGNL